MQHLDVNPGIYGASKTSTLQLRKGGNDIMTMEKKIRNRKAINEKKKKKIEIKARQGP